MNQFSSIAPNSQYPGENSSNTHNSAPVDFRAQNHALAAQQAADPRWQYLTSLQALAPAQSQRPAAARPATAADLLQGHTPPRAADARHTFPHTQPAIPPADQRAELLYIRPAAEHAEYKACPNTARIAAGLNMAPQLRVWLIARNQGRATGFLTRADLTAALEGHGITYGDRQLRRILNGGEGVFWHVHNSRRGVSIYGARRVGVALTNWAIGENPDLVQFTFEGVTYTNLPGRRPIYIPIRASLQEFKSEIYAAWLQHRPAPISRAALARLFAVTEDTLHNWEGHLKASKRLTVVAAYAKTFETEGRDIAQELALQDELPAHAYSYQVFIRTRYGWSKERRLGWRMPNLYITSEVKEHNSRGQGRKVNRAARAALDAFFQPVSERADGGHAAKDDGEHREKCYYNERDEAEQARHKGRGRRWLYFQGYRLGKARYEALTAPHAQTGISELSPAEWVAKMQENNWRVYWQMVA